MENLNSRPNFLTIIGRAIAKYSDRSTAFIAARLERMYQAHMERAQMRLAPSPMARCTERPHVSVESDSRVGENKSQTTGSGDHFCLVVIDESGSIEATGARAGDIGISDAVLITRRCTEYAKRTPIRPIIGRATATLTTRLFKKGAGSSHTIGPFLLPPEF
jgi:hypothetical protein